MNQLKFLVAVGLVATFLGITDEARCEGLKITELAPVLSEFRLAACSDPGKAFAKYGNKKAQGQFEALGKELCPASEPKGGWIFFFSTSVSAVNSLNKDSILALFYNPWSDVGLLTEWKGEKTPKITDAELVAGDVLRGEEKLNLTPHWRRRGKVPPPLEVLLSTGDTIREFLKRYVDAHEKKNSGDWRSRLPGFDDEKRRDENKTAVGVLFTQALLAMQVYVKEKEFTQVKKHMEDVQMKLIAGKTEEVLKEAKETSKDSRDLLLKLPLDWSRAMLVSVVQDPKNTFVFFSSTENPEYFASFWFKKGKKKLLWWKAKPRLSRIDLMGQVLSFDELDAIAKKAGVAKK